MKQNKLSLPFRVKKGRYNTVVIFTLVRYSDMVIIN